MWLLPMFLRCIHFIEKAFANHGLRFFASAKV